MAADSLAVLGGSFDPVHRGHLALASDLLQRLPLQELRLLPAACSPLKSTTTPFIHRLRMLELACAGQEGLRVDGREGERPPPSYSIDTLRELRQEHAGPLIFILGADVLPELQHWKDVEGLLDVAHLLIISRPDEQARSLDPAIAAWLQRQRQTVQQLGGCRQGGVAWLDTPCLPFASRHLRQALARGDRQAMDGLMPAVATYILEHQLYRQE